VGEREPGVATKGDERLETTLAGDLLDRARELGVILNDQNDPVAFAELVTVVRYFARQQERAVELFDRPGAKSPLVAAGSAGGAEARSDGGEYVAGRKSVNTEPFPGLDSTRISPPSRTAISRLIESPSPVPP